MSESDPLQPPAVESTGLRPLRVWPGIVALVAMVVLRNLPKLVADGPSMLWVSAAFGPALCALAILVWWCVASRASWQERVGGLVALMIGLVVTVALMDPTMRGVGVIVMAMPLGVAAFTLALIVGRKRRDRKRTWWAIAAGVLVFLSTTLLRSDGVWGNFAMDLQGRWSESAESRAIDFAASRQSSGAARAIDRDEMARSLAVVAWPGLRGPLWDGVQHGTVIERDWQSYPPRELWRIPVGPAWSSFVVAGDLLFTQEQRGELECVVCYRASDGSEVWTHSLPSRFFEPLGGLGPRATPTLHGQTLLAMGAEGFLVAVNAIDGTLEWKVDLRELAKRSIPMWGFSASPMVSGESVVIYAGGKDALGVLALDVKTGDARWTARCGSDSYASVQPIELAGQPYLAILSNEGLHVYQPSDGNEVLAYAWSHDGYRALQPLVIDGNKVLIPTGMGSGTRLIEVNEIEGKLVAEELWTSRKLKPDFNDCVLHDGYLYGFDDSIFTCIDLSNGEKTWKQGRYGKGQVLLLEDSSALVVQCETGEIVLLDANPREHRELGRIDGVHGKSWNHPVVVGNQLFARSGEEAVCYKLATVPATGTDPTSESVR